VERVIPVIKNCVLEGRELEYRYKIVELPRSPAPSLRTGHKERINPDSGGG
jgi:hypothetical protein